MKCFRAFLQKRKAKREEKRQNASQQATPSTAGAKTQAQAPLANTIRPTAAGGSTLAIALQNQTNSSTVYAYVTGRAIDNNGALVLMRNDGSTPYYPSSPSGTIQPLGADCAIRLGAPGSTVQVNIPHIAGGRIWFSIGQPLSFYLNPGPALVEPSVTNASDPNSQIEWGFAEFTWNSDQLYANISYVDFVSLPIALTLNTQNSGTMHVSGMNTTGLQQVADGLRQQHAADGKGWDQLIVNRSGTDSILRVLSPTQGMVINPNLFSGYYANYVNEVYERYANTDLAIDTQAAAGKVVSRSSGGVFNFGGSTFTKPTTSDIFTCNTGPFATGSNAQTNAIIPRLAAAYNRSVLLVTDSLPASQDLYYKNAVTNHYSRIVHGANLDGKGYAFPYDDVQPTGGKDQSGEVHAGDPTLFTVAVGGNNAYVA